MFVYHYSRYKAPECEIFSTLDECIERAADDLDGERAIPIKITEGGENNNRGRSVVFGRTRGFIWEEAVTTIVCYTTPQTEC